MSGGVALVTVQDGRHPMAVAPMVAALLVGCYGLLAPPSPTSAVDRFVTMPVANGGYYALLAASSALFLATRCLPDIRARVLWERISLLFFCAPLLVYPVFTGLSVDSGALLEGIASLGFGLGALARVGQITAQLRHVHRAVRDGR